MIKIQHDTKGQPFLEWEQAPVPGGCKRAWIQRKTDPSKDWAGTGRYLRQRNPTIELVAVQPEDELSVIEGLKHLETAVVPGIYDAALPDRSVCVTPEDAWHSVRDLARQAGLFVGVSGGAAMVASIAVAKELEQGTVVSILPDDGNKYVSLGLFA